MQMLQSISIRSKFKYVSSVFLLLIAMLTVIAHAQIIVSELQPFSLGRWTIGSGDITANQNICVGLLPQGPYSITVSGDSDNGEFVLVSVFDSIAYQLYFNDRPRVNGRTELAPGAALTGLRGKRFNPNNPCNRLTANLSIVIPEVNLTAASGGNYSSTIELLVSPE
jgi:hypothetical protein